MPPAHNRRNKGGKASDVVVSNAASTSVAAGPTLPRKTADRENDNKDDDHHGRSLPSAPPSVEPRPCANNRA